MKLLGHAVHPMLIVFPLGLLGMGAIFDLIAVFARNPELATASYWMIAAGIVTGLLAAVFGWLDWFGIDQGTRAKQVGLWHGVGNVVVVVLFAVAWLMRGRGTAGSEYSAAGVPLILEIAALVIALVTAWLGGELVERLGIAVDKGAHPNAPSSLSGEPATKQAAEARTTRAA